MQAHFIYIYTIQKYNSNRFSGIKHLIITGLDRPVLRVELVRPYYCDVKWRNNIRVGGLEAIDDFSEGIVCRNWQTRLATQSAMYFECIRIFEPPFEISLDLS